MQRIQHSINIPEDIKIIHSYFKDAGKDLFLVGGCVRDSLMGNEPKDFDLATSATPKEIKSILPSLFKKDLVGESFGVILTKINRSNLDFLEKENRLLDHNKFTFEDFEIATFRKDIGEGRRPDTVEFTSIEEDVKRRDLTINALFYDLETNEVVDIVGGLEDLKNKIIRTVGKAEDRFREDPLRKLRAIRFAARTGFDLDKDLVKSFHSDNSLEGVSEERIHDEFKRTIETAINPFDAVDLLYTFGFMELILPIFELSNGREIIGKACFSNDFIVQVAIILSSINHEDPNIFKDILHRMKYSTEEIRNIVFLLKVANLDRESHNYIIEFKKAQKIATVTRNQIAEFCAFYGTDFDQVSAALKFELTVKGDDSRLKGLKGKAIGDEIKKLEADNWMRFW